ncbi:histidine kinase dimerization/phosphoacceptor domain -containing protein [Longitalea arenae]|uniref:histidine kinase dimerization/phosphoacceptor domain -containing protein n=1 Tax=Longitalea arenae TaxID=2812558 RepID=UPI001966E4DC|nr:histidine kinase dimerization/phosphoacceptor domain -containing protein [Longitalea arenae]
MIRLFLFTCILGTLMLHSLSVAAQSTANNPAYIISKRFLSIEDGLASHEVFCGLQDNAGFMWFGTRNGLNRYDGKNCLLFTRQRNNLQNNKVVQLAKDDAGNLFIEYGSNGFQLTTNGMIDVLNTVTHEIKTLTAAFPNLPFKEQDVYWISNDGTDEVKFLTAWPFRLWKYSTKKGFILRYEIKNWVTKDSLAFSDYRSTGPLCMFANGKTLLKLSNQLPQYLVSNDKVIAFTQKDVLRSLPIGFNEEDALLLTFNFASNSDHFVVGMLTPDGKIVSNVDWSKYSLNNLQGRYWYQSASAGNGNACAFYIGPDALYVWEQNAFLKVVDKSELKAFESLFLYRLFADNQDNLWLCTSLGIIQLKIERNRFRQYFTTKQQSVQRNSQARGIYADNSGRVAANIWWHTFLQREASMQYVVNADEIKYALVDHDGALYSGGFNLFRYREEDNSLQPIPGGTGTEIWSMLSLNDSLLLLGRSNGVSLYNSRSSKFKSLLYASSNNKEPVFIYRFFKTNADTIWAVAENGLFTITPKNGQLVITRYQSSFTEGLSLLDAFADRDGIYWLATNGEGLYKWNKNENTFQQFNIASGLPSDVLYRIESDAWDNLWISSDNGLIRFNKKTFSATTFTTADGIAHNEFNRSSSFKANDGRLFFGGIDGINEFNPGDFIKDSSTFNVPLRIIAFNQYVGSENGLVNKINELLTTSNIILKPGDKFFTLEFQLLDYAKTDVHRYAYQIEGVDKDWNYINENSIRISGLPYGNFTLHIKAQNGEGAWSKSELRIPLLVLKPFYVEWWFLVLLTLLLILIVCWVIKWRTKQLAADKNKLERTVNERTALLKKALSEQETLLAEKDVLLKEIHHRVKNNLQVISGLLELQSRNLDADAKEALMEGRNRVRSIALIHQNLYQFENLSAIELSQFVKDLCRQVEALYKKQKDVSISIAVPVLYLDIDSAVPLGLILNELLSNSFKYAFNKIEYGKINIKINVVTDGKYELVYSDNGPGLPADFDLFRGSTLGIQLINDLSRQIGGNVLYENKIAQFTITFTNRNLRKTED